MHVRSSNPMKAHVIQKTAKLNLLITLYEVSCVLICGGSKPLVVKLNITALKFNPSAGVRT